MQHNSAWLIKQMSDLQFIPLASSSSGCCYILKCEGLPALIIDAGIRYSELRRHPEFCFLSVGACLISHSHGDHCLAAKDIAKATIPVYAHADTIKAIGLARHHRAVKMATRTVYNIASWRVLAFDAVHDAPGTVGFVIDGGGNRALYLTDSAYSPYRVNGLTHIFIEANHSRELVLDNTVAGSVHRERFERTIGTHMSIERLEEFLKANDLSRLREVHLLHLSDSNSDEQEFKERVQKIAGVPVYVAGKRQIL